MYYEQLTSTLIIDFNNYKYLPTEMKTYIIQNLAHRHLGRIHSDKIPSVQSIQTFINKRMDKKMWYTHQGSPVQQKRKEK